MGVLQGVDEVVAQLHRIGRRVKAQRPFAQPWQPGYGRDAPEGDDQIVVGPGAGARADFAPVQIDLLDSGVQEMERTIALEGTDGDDNIIRVGSTIHDRPEQGRKEERAVAVDDEDARVRAVAERLVKAKGCRHSTEASSEDQDIVPRARVGKERLRLVPVPSGGPRRDSSLDEGGNGTTNE